MSILENCDLINFLVQGIAAIQKPSVILRSYYVFILSFALASTCFCNFMIQINSGQLRIVLTWSSYTLGLSHCTYLILEKTESFSIDFL